LEKFIWVFGVISLSDKKNEYHLFPDRYVNAIEEDPAGNYFIPVMQDLLEVISSPESVCDVGCGTGLYTVGLKVECGCHIVGVDGSQHALVLAQKAGFDETYLIDNLSDDPLMFEDDTFDLVICKDVLEHLLDPQHLVQELARITKPGGHCLLHVPNHFPLIGRLRLLFFNTIDSFGYFPDAERWNFPHIRFFDKKSLIGLGELCGFTDVQEFSHHFALPARMNHAFPRLMKALAKRYPDAISEGITILFQKKRP